MNKGENFDGPNYEYDEDTGSPDFVVCLFVFSLNLTANNQIWWLIRISMTLAFPASPDIPHHDVDKGVLYEREEDKKCAGGHEHVDCLVKTMIEPYILKAGFPGYEKIG